MTQAAVQRDQRGDFVLVVGAEGNVSQRYVTLGPQVDTLVVDKTGTLTEGKPTVTKIVAVEGFIEDELLMLAASLEQGGEHPLAYAIVMAAKDKGLDLAKADDFDSPTGKGVIGKVNGQTVSLGNVMLMEERGVDIQKLSAQADELRADGATAIFMAVEGKAAGRIRTADLKITNHALYQLSYGGRGEQGTRHGAGRQSSPPQSHSLGPGPRLHGPWFLFELKRPSLQDQSLNPVASGALPRYVHCGQRRGCAHVLEETEEERGNSPNPDALATAVPVPGMHSREVRPCRMVRREEGRAAPTGCPSTFFIVVQMCSGQARGFSGRELIEACTRRRRLPAGFRSPPRGGSNSRSSPRAR